MQRLKQTLQDQQTDVAASSTHDIDRVKELPASDKQD